MFNKKETQELKAIVEAQADTIRHLITKTNELTEKVNKLDAELHPKYFGGK